VAAPIFRAGLFGLRFLSLRFFGTRRGRGGLIG